jgi:hypothetical protein
MLEEQAKIEESRYKSSSGFRVYVPQNLGGVTELAKSHKLFRVPGWV